MYFLIWRTRISLQIAKISLECGSQEPHFQNGTNVLSKMVNTVTIFFQKAQYFVQISQAFGKNIYQGITNSILYLQC